FKTCLVQRCKDSHSSMVSPELVSIEEIICAVLTDAMARRNTSGLVLPKCPPTMCTMEGWNMAAIVNRKIIHGMSQCIQNHFMNTEELALADERCRARCPHSAIDRGIKIFGEPDDDRPGIGLLHRIGRFNYIVKRQVRIHQYDVRLMENRHRH